MKASPPASRPRAFLLAALGVLGAALALLAFSPAASAAKPKSCAQQIVEDWYDNQRVDKIYPLHCYHDALNSLGPDTQDYTDLPEAILRALAYAQADQPDPGAGGALPGKNGGKNDIKPIAYRRTADVVQRLDPGTTQASGKTSSTSGPSSVPIPLIVLAGLAGLLLIAGGAGYVARRVQGRRGDPPSGA